MDTGLQNVLTELDTLHLPIGQYAIFGSAPLALIGLRTNIDDLDIVVTQALFDELTVKYNLDPSQHPCGCIVIGRLEIGPSWFDIKEPTSELIQTADIVDGYPFVKLRYVLEWKTNRGWDKDKIDVLAIKKYLAEQAQ